MNTDVIEALLHQSEQLPTDERLILIERLVASIRPAPSSAGSTAVSSPSPSRSRWNRLAQRVREAPISLGDATAPLREDLQAFREQFAFRHDEA